MADDRTDILAHTLQVARGHLRVVTAQRSLCRQNLYSQPKRDELTRVLVSPTPVLGMKVKLEKGVIWLFSKIDLSTTISIKRSRQELSIDMDIHGGIFQNNQMTFFPCFTFIPRTGLVFTM